MISVDRNYSIRAVKESDDELGHLVEGFNQMLTQIEERDADLRNAHDELERRVEQRTAELQSEVADRRNAEERLAERTAYLNALIERTPLGIVAINSSQQITICNPAFEQLFGYRQAEIVGRELDDLICGDQEKQEATELTQRGVSGEYIHTTGRRRRKDGTIFDAEIYAVPLIMNGELAGSFGLYSDITERRKAQEALELSESRRIAFQEGSLDGIMALNAEQGITEFNPVMEKMIGIRRDEALGKSFEDVIAPRRLRAAYRADMDSYLSTGQSEYVGQLKEAVLCRNDGSEFYADVAITAMHTGSATYFIATIRDISDQKSAERRQAVQHGVTSILADSPSLSDAANRMLQFICEKLGSDIGEFWIVEPETRRLRRAEVFHVSDEALTKFVATTSEVSFAPGQDMIGRVWLENEPQWEIDIGERKDFNRVAQIKEAGLRSGFAFPIAFENQVNGVVTIFRREPSELDAPLLAVFRFRWAVRLASSSRACAWKKSCEARRNPRNQQTAPRASSWPI